MGTCSRSAGAIALSIVALSWSSTGLAQPDSKPATEVAVEAPRSVPLPAIAARSEELRSRLREASSSLATRPEVASIEAGLPEARQSLDERKAETKDVLDGTATLERLADAERSWLKRQSEFALWRESLAKRASAVEVEIERLGELRSLWTETLAEAERSEAPTEIRSTIRGNLEAIAATRKIATDSRAKLLTLLNAVAQDELVVSDVLASIGSARALIRSRILEPDSAPLWASLLGASSVTSIPSLVQASIESDSEEIMQFVVGRRQGLIPVALAFGAALAVALLIRARLLRRQSSVELEGSIEVFGRPYSIAAIVAFLAGASAFPFAPSVATNVAGAFLLVPVVRVVNPLVHPALRPILYTLGMFYLTDRVRDLFDEVVLLERVLYFAETVGGTAFLLWLLRPSRLENLPAHTIRSTAALGISIRMATAILAASAFANLLGYTTFSRVLGEGLLQTAYLSVLFYAAFRIGLTAAVVVFSSARARRSRIIATQGPLLVRWTRLLLALSLGVVWANNALEAFAIREQVIGALSAVLTTPLTLGTVSVSLGDVLGFALTIFAAAMLSRVIRVLLGEDVLPRISLGRGVANAISMSVHYVILLGGFFLALGAAGVDFSRFTLLAGAFGVGIGFGMQNIVNNFVSGLILLFERPIQVGDTIEVGGLLGHVKHIGIRASLVRTLRGAEVIVPNGNLISAEVTNWTLSDHHRRVELPVGVAYGNRPATVIEVLERVVASEPRILRPPAPSVLFLGFGDSSLDFEVRFWAPNYELFLQLASDVASAIYDALEAEGIAIPFPQRDLHLRSVDASIVARLQPGDEGRD